MNDMILDLKLSFSTAFVTVIVKFVSQLMAKYVHKIVAYVSELVWRFLELHIAKIVLGSVMLLACYDVSWLSCNLK